MVAGNVPVFSLSFGSLKSLLIVGGKKLNLFLVLLFLGGRLNVQLYISFFFLHLMNQ